MHYFELSASVMAGKNYRLWLRMKGANNSGYSDSVWVQTSDSVDSAGTPIFRIGTTSATRVNLQDCTGCTISGWGWQDNGFGTGVLGPVLRFANGGEWYRGVVRNPADDAPGPVHRRMICPQPFMAGLRRLRRP